MDFTAGPSSRATQNLQLGTSVSSQINRAPTALLGSRVTDYFRQANSSNSKPISFQSAASQFPLGGNLFISNNPSMPSANTQKTLQPLQHSEDEAVVPSFTPSSLPSDEDAVVPEVSPEASSLVNPTVESLPDSASVAVANPSADIIPSALSAESFTSALPSGLTGLAISSAFSSYTSGQISNQLNAGKMGQSEFGHAFDATNRSENLASLQTAKLGVESALISGGSIFGPEGLGAGLLAAGAYDIFSSNQPSNQNDVMSTGGDLTTANDL